MSQRILVVDDSPDICEMVRLYLERKGYEVGTAENGVVALQKLKTLLPDLILLDVLMPEMDGYTFYKEIKKDPVTRDIPVLIITARSMMEDSFSVMGVDGFLVKPVSAEYLLSQIEQILSLKAIRQQATTGLIKPISRRLLVIGPHAETLKQMSAYAQRLDFQVAMAHEGSQAISMAVKFVPGIIFIDVQLTDISSGEIVEILRRLAQFEETPIIGYSQYDTNALDDPNNRKKMLCVNEASQQLTRCGANHYMGRYLPELFIQTLREFGFQKGVP